MEITLAVLDKKNAGATEHIIAAFKAPHFEKPKYCFDIASPYNLASRKDVKDFLDEMESSQTAIGCAYSKNHLLKEHLAHKENAAFSFEGTIYSSTQKSSTVKIIAERFLRNGDKTIQTFLKRSEGDFSLIIAEPERILAARDSVGVQPLYYGENADIAAFGSNKKILWVLGVEKANSFPPGHTGSADCHGFRFKPVKTLVYSKPKRVTMQEAAATLAGMLKRSVQQRVRDLKEVAVAFSGGLDSGVVAFLAKEYNIGVHLVHVSLANQPETEEAKRAAEELKLPISVCLFDGEEVAKIAPKVVELIEEPDPVKLAVGIPFYWTAENAAKAGFKVLLAGQGADELFGGYQRYLNEYALKGDEEVRKTMFADVSKLHESNIERDRKICAFHDVELRLPFASYQVAQFAVSLPVELKIEKKGSQRKLVLRKMAENMGLPASIVHKPKKAVQYATGVNDALKKLAKKRKITVAEYVNKLFRKE